MLIDVTINVKNMTCPACETKLNNKLSMLEGVKKAHANFNTGTIQVEYDDELVALSDINGTIIKAGYELGKKLNANKTLFIVYLSISTFLLISLLLIKILTNWGILSLVSFWDYADDLQAPILVVALVMGLISSVHCIFMCGSFTLARNIKELESKQASDKKISWPKVKNTVFYNLGRVISYTFVGIIFGAVGQFFSFLKFPIVSGLLFILIALLMIIIGLNLTGFFPFLKKFNPRLPQKILKPISKFTRKTNFVFVHGLFTCLIPCGPLYAMYLIASTTGSWYMGGLAMLIFAIGTLPLMLGSDIAIKYFNKKWIKILMLTGSTIIILLSIIMLTTGIFNFGLGVNLW